MPNRRRLRVRYALISHRCNNVGPWLAPFGQIRIETGASDGTRLTLNFLGPGDLFGEVAVLDGQSRTADATAGEPTELFVLRREDFLAHLEREPRVAIKLIILLCQRIRWMSERMEESVLQPLSVRLARRLCALASDFGSEVHISQEQLVARFIQIEG